ncbi:MAG TPA: glycosyltransferase family 87 protein [Nitrospirota bacterium]|nr:glycosyltransferase family 87 protein [Nitrospirota bacterium]
MAEDGKRARALAWAAWAALFGITAAIIMCGSSRSVVPSYRLAALSWIAGQNLYDGTGFGGFVYFPQSAILFVPIALLKPVAGEVVWRFVNIGVFAAGLRVFSRLRTPAPGKDLFPLMTVVAIPLAWDCARNGQATLIMTGLMLLAVSDVFRGRWWRAVAWLCLGVAFKPLVMVLVLLIMAVNRPMTVRLAIGVAVVALLPFLAQSPAYAARQYAACFTNMSTAAHVGVVAIGWTTPFTALRVAGIDIPERVQTVTRLLAAAATLVLCFIAFRRLAGERYAFYLFSLCALYVMLFSPRTENNTYVMLAPAFGLFLASAFRVDKRTGEGIFLSILVLILLSSRPISKLVAPHAEQIWIPPLIGVCFCGYVLYRFFTEPMATAKA